MLRHRLNLDFFPPERLAFFGPLASASTAFPFSFAGFGLASLGFSAVALPPIRLSARMGLQGPGKEHDINEGNIDKDKDCDKTTTQLSPLLTAATTTTWRTGRKPGLAGRGSFQLHQRNEPKQTPNPHQVGFLRSPGSAFWPSSAPSSWSNFQTWYSCSCRTPWPSA